MTTTLGIVVMAAAILLSVMLHEFGHYWTAKRYGMKVTQFFVGMGPTLWSTQRGETEFGIKAFPIGGFVRIVGQTSLEPIDPADEPRAMWRQPAGRRAVVMSAGSAMHFIIGIALFFALFASFGHYKTTQQIEVADCISVGCTERGPASAAGLLTGDVIKSVDGKPVDGFNGAIAAIKAHDPGQDITLVVDRNGTPATIVTALKAVPQYDDKGQPALDGAGQPVVRNLIGVSGPRQVQESLNPIQAVGYAGSTFWETTKGTFAAIGKIPASIPKLFHPKQDDEGGDRLISVVGAARLGGDAVTHGGIENFLALVASLNISIGLFNLLPLLPLDGGHLAIIGFERARSRIARALRRPDPGRVDMLKLFPAMVAFIGFFGMLSILMIFKDIVNPIASPF